MDNGTAEFSSDASHTGTGLSGEVTGLLSQLRSDDEEQRALAADALQALEMLSITDLPAVLAASQDSHSVVAYWACRLMTRLLPHHPQVRDGLLNVMAQHSDRRVRVEAARCLARLPQPDAELVAILHDFAKTHPEPRLLQILEFD
ncbi:MAG: hypothetical protein KatS3mg111_0187 [Pirellulaceae bacterium]|nr:MAG: hypothetical protein KatS3mg111_0187 [Pirellulaceae bacterium]